MGNDRKSQIIKAAVKRFARYGLNKTTLDEIAGDLRMGKATIYHYFKSKEELFYKTLEYDVSLFINDIKQIFNKKGIPLKERFIEYFNYKQEIYNRYKLLFDFMIRYLEEASLEEERKILRKLLQGEENVVNRVLKSFYKKKNKTMNPDMPKFIAMQGWGVLFENKLSEITGSENSTISKELLYKSLENVLN